MAAMALQGKKACLWAGGGLLGLTLNLALAGAAQAQVVSYQCQDLRKVVVNYLQDGGQPHARVTLEGRSRRLTLDPKASSSGQEVYKGSSYTLRRAKPAKSAKPAQQPPAPAMQIAKETLDTTGGQPTAVSMLLFDDCRPRKP